MACAGCNGDVLRVVLLGKTGAGKSSLGNSLTGYKPPKTTSDQQRDEEPHERKDPTEGFKVGRGLKSETVFCDWCKADRDGIIIEVTDTPGLCDTHLDEGKIYREVAKSVAVAEPGPHVIIFTLRCDRRFTDEEYKAYLKIQEIFSEEMNKYQILVFNGMDCYNDEDGETSLEEQRQCLTQEITKFGDKLNVMIQKSGNRFFGINNKAPREEKDQQIKDLIHMMKEMVKNNGQNPFYKTTMTDQIMEKVEKMVEEEASAQGESMTKARDDVKAKIISEKVEPGWYESVQEYVYNTAAEVVNGVTEMCSVM